jgi:hypothetical protein
MPLPSFTTFGLLPPGDHPLTITELRQSFLVSGQGADVPTWGNSWRGQLVDNLELFVRQLWQVGVERIFVNGSFVTGKPDPGDIDAYVECTLTDYPLILARLMLLEPLLPWELAHRDRLGDGYSKADDVAPVPSRAVPARHGLSESHRNH